jgi:hypothetical protein
MRRVVVVVIVALLALTGGCRRRSSPGAWGTPTGPLAGSADAHGPFVFDDRDVAVATLAGSLPAPVGWPKDFPLYPGAAIIADRSSADGGVERGRVLILETRAPAADVAVFYAKALEPHGRSVLDLGLGVGRTMMWERPDGKTWTVVIMEMGGATQIQLSEND